jgi:hypothetical protein
MQEEKKEKKKDNLGSRRSPNPSEPAGPHANPLLSSGLYQNYTLRM